MILTFDNSNVLINSSSRAHGMSVRCIRDNEDTGCTPSEAPETTEATEVLGNSFKANWESVVGTGNVYYVLEVSRNSSFTSFVTDYENYNAGSSLYATVEGLICGTTYYYRVRAFDACGYSAYSNVISVETETEGCVNICTLGGTLEHNGFTYGAAINPTTNRCWLDRNLGASQVATSSTDEDSYGDLYQWGRGADGHQLRTSNTTAIVSNSDNPGHGNFIASFHTNNYDWRSPKNDNLWQGANGTNNPCPNGFRLPTENELYVERLSWSSNDAAGAFASPLKLPLAGRRGTDGSTISQVGSNGYYWSSKVSFANVKSLSIWSNNAYMNNEDRGEGQSVRCIYDNEDIGCIPAEAPLATSATEVTEDSFIANWESVEGTGTVSYLFDLSYDCSFPGFEPYYENYNTGSSTYLFISNLDCDRPFCYRVRVLDNCGYSEYSNTIYFGTEECSD